MIQETKKVVRKIVQDLNRKAPEAERILHQVLKNVPEKAKEEIAKKAAAIMKNCHFRRMIRKYLS